MRDLCSLIWLALVGLFRSRAALQAEILTLRHQLNVLRRKSPQRLTFSSIDRLVLSSTWAKTDAFFRRLFEVRSLMLRELGPAAYLKSSALALNMPSWVRDHDADLLAAEARANETISVPEIVLSRIAAIVAHDRREQLQRVRAPTLAICARDDMVTPLYFTEELVRLIPDARAYVLPDGGHFYPNVHGAEFRRVMTSFLLDA